jgi:Fe-S cluster biogenesis protein NfuA
MSQLTLKQGIENLLVNRIAGVTSVEAEVVAE